MLILYNFIFSFISGWVCARYAKKLGRNPFQWFMVGACFGLIGIVIVIFFLRQAPKPAPAAILPVARLQAMVESQTKKFWYYLDGEKQQNGPMSFEALSKAWMEGKVNNGSWIWNEELENWKRFEEVITIADG